MLEIKDMAKLKIKLIIDTNLWISFLISNNYTQLDRILITKKAKLIFSQELLEEFIDVVKRPKFQRFFSHKDIESLLEIIQDYSIFIDVKSNVKICRDEKDNFLLSLAKDSKADYLITGDKDLLVLETIDKTKILTITDFFKIVE